MLVTILLTLICYLIGSMMFSVWLGRLKGLDIRKYGDGNPGAINAFKAGGWIIGIFSMLLDYFKGFLPLLFIVRKIGIEDLKLVPIAIAPVLGHAFSPFLGFGGGKAIGVTFGIWSGLTLWMGPTVLGAAFLFFKFVTRIKQAAWIVLLGMICLLVFILLLKPYPVLIMVWVLNFSILLFKHRGDLGKPKLD